MLSQIPDLLTRYILALGSSECQFWGVDTSASPTGPPVDVQCTKWFTRNQRLVLGQFLTEAVENLEETLNFALRDRWITDEQLPFQRSYHTRWNYIESPGIMATSNIALSETVDHTNDPAEIGPVATTVTDTKEVHVFFEGTDEEIIPSKITIAGGQLDIEIPRCRMVLPSAQINDEAWGVDYTDLAKFEDEVDIKRIYTDTSVQATMIKCHQCNSSTPCTDETETGCIKVKNAITGYIKITPATYSGGAWSYSNCGCRCGYSNVRVNYKIYKPTTLTSDRIILQLAHALMPEAPCGCDYIRRYWAQARTNPEALDAVRLNCPYGTNDGAYNAWRWALNKRLIRASIL